MRVGISMKKRKKIKEPSAAANFPQHALLSINHYDIYFYGASEYILGRLAGHALNVSMDAFMYSSSLFLLLLLFLLVALETTTA